MSATQPERLALDSSLLCCEPTVLVRTLLCQVHRPGSSSWGSCTVMCSPQSLLNPTGYWRQHRSGFIVHLEDQRWRCRSEMRHGNWPRLSKTPIAALCGVLCGKEDPPAPCASSGENLCRESKASLQIALPSH